MLEAADAVHAARKSLGLSGSKMSQLIGISGPHYYNIENGKASVTTRTLKRIADAIGYKLVIRLEPTNGVNESVQDSDARAAYLRCAKKGVIGGQEVDGGYHGDR